MPRLSIPILALAMCMATPCVAQETIPDKGRADVHVIELVEAFDANDATEEQTLQLLALVLQDPDRLQRAGADPDRLRQQLLQDPVVIQSVQDAERTPPLGFRHRANKDQAERWFQQALDAAPSDEIRADYLYIRERRGYGGGGCTRALEIFPTHAPCRYENLNALGRRVGTQSSLAGRFNYWCLADRYRQLAASTGNTRIASAASRAAKQYERAGPTREQLDHAGYTSGQMVSCPIVEGRTPVRMR